MESSDKQQLQRPPEEESKDLDALRSITCDENNNITLISLSSDGIFSNIHPFNSEIQTTKTDTTTDTVAKFAELFKLYRLKKLTTEKFFTQCQLDNLLDSLPLVLYEIESEQLDLADLEKTPFVVTLNEIITFRSFTSQNCFKPGIQFKFIYEAKIFFNMELEIIIPVQQTLDYFNLVFQTNKTHNQVLLTAQRLMETFNAQKNVQARLILLNEIYELLDQVTYFCKQNKLRYACGKHFIEQYNAAYEQVLIQCGKWKHPCSSVLSEYLTRQFVSIKNFDFKEVNIELIELKATRYTNTLPPKPKTFNIPDFECQFCHQNISYQTPFSLQKCGHSFHQKCYMLLPLNHTIICIACRQPTSIVSKPSQKIYVDHSTTENYPGENVEFISLKNLLPKLPQNVAKRLQSVLSIKKSYLNYDKSSLNQQDQPSKSEMSDYYLKHLTTQTIEDSSVHQESGIFEDYSVYQEFCIQMGDFNSDQPNCNPMENEDLQSIINWVRQQQSNPQRKRKRKEMSECLSFLQFQQ